MALCWLTSLESGLKLKHRDKWEMHKIILQKLMGHLVSFGQKGKRSSDFI